MLWCVLNISTAEFVEGTGNVSAGHGFYEQFYTKTALWDSKEAAQEAIEHHCNNRESLYSNKSRIIIQHFEVIPYEG